MKSERIERLKGLDDQPFNGGPRSALAVEWPELAKLLCALPMTRKTTHSTMDVAGANPIDGSLGAHSQSQIKQAWSAVEMPGCLASDPVVGTCASQ